MIKTISVESVRSDSEIREALSCVRNYCESYPGFNLELTYNSKKRKRFYNHAENQYELHRFLTIRCGDKDTELEERGVLIHSKLDDAVFFLKHKDSKYVKHLQLMLSDIMTPF